MNKKNLPLSLAMLLAGTTAFAADARSRHPSGPAPSSAAAADSSDESSSGSASNSRPAPSAAVPVATPPPAVRSDPVPSRHPSSESSSSVPPPRSTPAPTPSDGVLDRHPSGSSSSVPPARSTPPSTPPDSVSGRHPSGSTSSAEPPPPSSGSSGDSRSRHHRRPRRGIPPEPIAVVDDADDMDDADYGEPPQPPRPRRMFGNVNWIVGGMLPEGGTVGLGYEATHWRVGAVLQSDVNVVSFLGIEAAWIQQTSNVSPYVGVGLGAAYEEVDTLGVKVEAGVVLLRRQRVHVFVGVHTVMMFDGRNRMLNPGLHARLAF